MAFHLSEIPPLVIPLVAVRPLIPQAWRDQATQMVFSESGRIQAIAVQIVFFAFLDLVLLVLALVRFRHSKLIQRASTELDAPSRQV